MLVGFIELNFVVYLKKKREINFTPISINYTTQTSFGPSDGILIAFRVIRAKGHDDKQRKVRIDDIPGTLGAVPR